MKASMTTVGLLFALLCPFAASPTHAAIAVRIEGENQGVIQGDMQLEGEVGSIEALSFSSTIYVPYDPNTGAPSSNAVYTPIQLTKDFDRSSVLLTHALHTLELLQVEIRLYYTAQQPVNYYTILLENAHLVDFSQGGLAGEQPGESLGFVFSKITWRDEIEQTETTDRWADVAAAVLPPGPSPQLSLLPPLPNPSRNETLVRFDLPVASRATLDVYDVKGRHVSRLFDDHTSHARTVLRWNGRDDAGKQVANGLYLMKLRWSEGEVTQRVTLMR